MSTQYSRCDYLSMSHSLCWEKDLWYPRYIKVSMKLTTKISLIHSEMLTITNTYVMPISISKQILFCTYLHHKLGCQVPLTIFEYLFSGVLCVKSCVLLWHVVVRIYAYVNVYIRLYTIFLNYKSGHVVLLIWCKLCHLDWESQFQQCRIQ